VFAFCFICWCTRVEVCDVFGWKQLGETLRCSLGFALSNLWLLRLQPEMLVFQCRDAKLGKKLIRHCWNCIICRQNGNMFSDVTEQRSRLLEKAEKTSQFLARAGWVVVLWRQVLRALQKAPFLSVTEWVQQRSLLCIGGRNMLSSLK